jgi:hypothetical protein
LFPDPELPREKYDPNTDENNQPVKSAGTGRFEYYQSNNKGEATFTTNFRKDDNN